MWGSPAEAEGVKKTTKKKETCETPDRFPWSAADGGEAAGRNAAVSARHQIGFVRQNCAAQREGWAGGGG